MFCEMFESVPARLLLTPRLAGLTKFLARYSGRVDDVGWEVISGFCLSQWDFSGRILVELQPGFLGSFIFHRGSGWSNLRVFPRVILRVKWKKITALSFAPSRYQLAEFARALLLLSREEPSCISRVSQLTSRPISRNGYFAGTTTSCLALEDAGGCSWKLPRLLPAQEGIPPRGSNSWRARDWILYNWRNYPNKSPHVHSRSRVQ